MCTPMAAVGIATVALGFMQQTQQAKVANEAASDQYKAEADRARQESLDRQNQLSHDTQEESQRLHQQREALALQTLREKAGIRVASAEGGVGGVSKIRSFLTSEIQAGVADSDITTQETNTAFNTNQRLLGIGNAASDRISNAQSTFVTNSRRKPGVMDLGVGLLSNSDVASAGMNQASKLFQPQTGFKSGQVITGAKKV